MVQRLRWEHRPRRGDKFHDSNRGAWRSNGYILDVLWGEDPKEVVVKFYTKEHKVYETDTYTFDDIEGKWTDKHGGTWLIDEGPDAAKQLV